MSKKVKQKENRRVTGRRTFLLGSGMFLVTSFLAGRLYQLQVAQNNRYQRLSDRNQFDRRAKPSQSQTNPRPSRPRAQTLFFLCPV